MRIARREKPQLTLFHGCDIGLPIGSRRVMRHVPYVTYAHSAKSCQCSSRIPPAVSRMSTPVMVVEIAKDSWFTCRAQPPFWIRFEALLNDAQNCGRSFVS